MAITGVAVDISNGDYAKREEIMKKEGWLQQIGFASGIYGCNGMLFKGHNTNELYVITHRCPAIYIFS